MKKTCHIFSGGIINDTSFIKINENDMVICADSGYRYAVKLGIVPDMLVGDFDSYSGYIPDVAEIHRSVPEKDDTDTMLSLKLAIERGAEHVVIYGAFGGRIDHTIANIQTLKFAIDNGCSAELRDSDNIVMLQQNQKCEYRKMEGWYFSLFSYSESTKIKCLSGVKYPLDNVVLTTGFPLGVSNEILSDKAVVDVEYGSLLVVYSKM